MTEIIPGIHQLKIPIPNNPLGNTNVYLVQGDSEYLLIDTGWNSEEALQSLQKQLNELGLEIKDITQIIVTHAHPDHYGLAGQLRQLSGAKISLHQLEQEHLAPRQLNDMEEFFRQSQKWLQSHGAPDDELPVPWAASAGARRHPVPALPDITLQGGEIISIGVFSLQVLWTPGHARGHICLYAPTQKVLFSGDHILPTITPHISLQNQSGLNPLGDFYNSLNMVKQLDVRLVLPAHEHIITDLATRVDEIIEHHEQRIAEMLVTIKAKPKTAYQISSEITWMPSLGGVSFQNLTPWDKRMATAETLAHLEAMRVDGKVEQSQRDGIIYYQPA